MAKKRVTHTVDKLEAGQRDSIRRAQAKAEGASKEKYNNLPSDAEVNQAEAERLAGDTPDEEPQGEGDPGTTDDDSGEGDDEHAAGPIRRGPGSPSS